MTRPGPTLRWFLGRALDGFSAKLALFDALVATTLAIVAGVFMRIVGGPRAAYEQVVPMLGTGLRWSVALPLAFAGLAAVESDRKAGLLALAERRGVSLSSWVRGRAVGVAVMIAVTVGVPMILVSVVFAGLGGGLEGALARLSLVLPSVVTGVASGALLGFGAVALGAHVTSRPLALAVLVGSAAFGVALERALPGAPGAIAHALVSPLLALERLQATLFAERGASSAAGATGAAVVLVVSFFGTRVASAAIDQGGVRS